MSEALTLHASCVALGEAGLLVLGPSGVGKSALALQMMALGAQLVSDDQTLLTRDADDLIACAPAALFGLIEARRVGILRAPAKDKIAIRLVVDLSVAETERLPMRRSIKFLGLHRELLHGSQDSHFPAALMCYLQWGRHA